MARSEAEEGMEAKIASNEKSRDDVVAIDLPAPQGWTKKFTPKKGGRGTPKRNEIVFISPTGEEIKSKRQLDQYLKSHPGGPSASEFDWGTGDTPRRSSRISEKSKAIETPENEPPKKAQKKSSSKKVAKEKDDTDGEGDTAEQEKEAATEEIKESAEVEMKDAEGVEDHKEGEVAPADKDDIKESEQKTNAEIYETNKEKPESEGATNGTSATKEDDAENKSLPVPELEQAEHEAPSQLPVSELEQAEPEAPSQLPVPELEQAEHEAPSQLPPSQLPVPELEQAEPEAPSQLPVPELEQAEPEAPSQLPVPNEADAKAEEESKDLKMGQEMPTEEVDNTKEDESEGKGSLKNQEVGKPVDNNTVSCEEAPHEPKAPQVSC